MPGAAGDGLALVPEPGGWPAADRPLLWAGGRAMSTWEFLAGVRRVAAALPGDGPVTNLCEDRGRFLIGYCAALARGRTTLLPPSRAPLAVAEVTAAHAGSHRCDDDWVARALARGLPSGPGGQEERDARQTPGAPHPREAHEPDGFGDAAAILHVPRERVAEIAFTSGTTGTPRAHVKRWGTLLGSTEFNSGRIRESLAPRYGGARPWIVATVPPQHMYGTETSVLLPLAADMAVHAGRPLYPADVAAALAEVPEPRVLVTTPVHLQVLVASGERFARVGVIVSATAPLDRRLAAEAERAFGAVLLEMFGSTETCVIATRRTAHEDAWHLYPGVALEPGCDGTRVSAPWFDAPAELQDVVELVEPARFVVRGRNADMVEVAGKRASLADLTRRLLAIEGVRDGVVFQPDTGVAPARGALVEAGLAPPAGGVRRVAALVVAPHLTAEAILAELGRGIDPAFLPRPLVLVPALPRNELGKLSRGALLELAARHLPRPGELDRCDTMPRS